MRSEIKKATLAFSDGNCCGCIWMYQLICRRKQLHSAALPANVAGMVMGQPEAEGGVDVGLIATLKAFTSSMIGSDVAGASVLMFGVGLVFCHVHTGLRPEIAVSANSGIFY